jgi:hypothetical protein
VGGNPRHGSSWHESRPGILHAYDATDIRRELWNSLEVPARDDCGEYSKMAPPSIANGKVYLASFGPEDTGSGQFCVYGLLPRAAGAELPAATGVRAEIVDSTVTLKWSPVEKAQFYRVFRSSTLESGAREVATGLTMLQFTDPAPERGESAAYSVVAVGTNGASPMSTEMKVVRNKKPKPMDD